MVLWHRHHSVKCISFLTSYARIDTCFTAGMPIGVLNCHATRGHRDTYWRRHIYSLNVQRRCDLQVTWPTLPAGAAGQGPVVSPWAKIYRCKCDRFLMSVRCVTISNTDLLPSSDKHWCKRSLFKCISWLVPFCCGWSVGFTEGRRESRPI